MLKRHETTWVLVCDGARGRIFVHRGPGSGLELVSSEDHAASHRSTHEMGSERPGRTFDSTGTGGRHAMEPRVDWHRFEKQHFAREMAALVNQAASDKLFDRLIVVAPARTLGELRGALDLHLGPRLAGELAKDLTHLDGHELAGHLGGLIRL
jgi:protein required for attachment to host cells